MDRWCNFHIINNKSNTKLKKKWGWFHKTMRWFAKLLCPRELIHQLSDSSVIAHDTSTHKVQALDLCFPADLWRHRSNNHQAWVTLQYLIVCPTRRQCLSSSCCLLCCSGVRLLPLFTLTLVHFGLTSEQEIRPVWIWSRWINTFGRNPNLSCTTCFWVGEIRFDLIWSWLNSCCGFFKLFSNDDEQHHAKLILIIC